MSTFIYEAYNKNGASVRGEFEASTKEEVVTHLLKRSLTPVSIESLAASGGLSRNFSFFERISAADTLFFVRNLATGLRAGLPVLEALAMLEGDNKKEHVGRMLRAVMSAVKSGQPLSKGFAPYRDHFPVAFIGMLRAGEISGELDRMLDALAQYLRKEYTLRSRVRSALVYPMILLFASLAVVTLLLAVVLPKLSGAFASSDVALPWVTQFFMALSHALTYSPLLDLVLVLGGALSLVVLFRVRAGRTFLTGVFMHVPVVGDVIRKVALVRFLRTLGNLLQSGISALEAFEITIDAIGNSVYAAALRDTQRRVKEGASIADALARYPELFPHMLLGLTRVGEKTGTLDKIFVELADFYDEELDTRLRDLTAMIEPLLLLVMGLLVGAIALSILMPIYQLVGSFS